MEQIYKYAFNSHIVLLANECVNQEALKHMGEWPDTFKPKEWQKDFLPLILGLLKEENSVAMEIPTGGGKTVLGLGVAYNVDGSILYLAHTRDQLERVWSDNRKFFKFPLMYLMGKRNLCIRPELWTSEEDDPDSERSENPCEICILKKFQNEIDCNNIDSPGGFVNKIRKEAIEGFEIDKKRKRIIITSLDGKSREENTALDVPYNKIGGFCPYYSVKRSLPRAKLIVGTYNYALNPWIRENFFDVKPPRNYKNIKFTRRM